MLPKINNNNNKLGQLILFLMTPLCSRYSGTFRIKAKKVAYVRQKNFSPILILIWKDKLAMEYGTQNRKSHFSEIIFFLANSKTWAAIASKENTSHVSTRFFFTCVDWHTFHFCRFCFDNFYGRVAVLFSCLC